VHYAIVRPGGKQLRRRLLVGPRRRRLFGGGQRKDSHSQDFFGSVSPVFSRQNFLLFIQMQIR